ncbi:MAG: hypothetical protein JW909_11575 [Planctomycetes bacterium]|nr:hypothetical protein [Planctomycetota bacterium]
MTRKCLVTVLGMAVFLAAAGCAPSGDESKGGTEASRTPAEADTVIEEAPAPADSVEAAPSPTPAETAEGEASEAEEGEAAEKPAVETVAVAGETRESPADPLLSRTYTLDQFPQRHVIEYENKLTSPVKLSVKWDVVGNAWEVAPLEGETVIEPGSKGHVASVITLSRTGQAFPFPLPTLNATMKMNEYVLTSQQRQLAVQFMRSARVPTMTTPPTIDGTMEEAWKSNAAMLTGFIAEGGEQLADPQTDVCLAKSGSALYVFFRCYQENPEELVANAENRDDPVWRDDSVEVFITSPTEKDAYYHLLVSSKGIIQDARNQEDSWNGEWQVQTATGKNQWTAEIAIPAATLGLKSFDDVKELRVNFCRNNYVKIQESSSWACMYGTFHAPELFARIEF